MPEYIGICDKRKGSLSVSYNTQREVTLQVSKYLLRDRSIRNPVTGLRQSAFGWGTPLYFMSSKWKCLTGEFYAILCPQSEKFYLENSTVFHVYEVTKFNWRYLLYLKSTKWESLTEEFYDILCLVNGKV